MRIQNRTRLIRRRWLRRMIGAWLIVCMLVSVTSTTASADSVPGLAGSVTEENVLKLLRQFDKDGYFLVDYGYRRNTPWMSYYSQGDRLIDSLDTVVHEEFHDYSIVGNQKQRIYTGRKHAIIVDFTKIFKTVEMVRSVPKRCRTTRFPTYVSKPVPNLASNVQGIYGLLNEFSAYHWGMNNNIHMFAYYDRFADAMNTWNSFVADGASNRLAYAEFKYYILHYLYYAKQHHPLVYRQIMSNKKFRTAYRINERHFWKMIQTFEKDLTTIKGKLEKQGYHVEYTEEAFVAFDYTGSGNGMSLLNDEYSVLMKELEKDRYVSIQKALLK